jgi:hypothetical protein
MEIHVPGIFGVLLLQVSSGLVLKDSTLRGKPVLKHSTCEVPWLAPLRTERQVPDVS